MQHKLNPLKTPRSSRFWYKIHTEGKISMTFCHLNEADSSAPSIFFSIYQDKKQKKDLEKMFSQESGFGIP